MEMECDLVVNYINGFLPFEKQWKEEIEKHLSICRECQELMVLMNELPELANEKTFLNGMKARILATVFVEETDSGSSSPGYSI
ncbi:hypothetical protein [Planococcus sp. ISL-110]|uniref:hypothetical protein n=1 Tax=Planococcus sp. ISL-110 TaxID=2819167 RepID=UPI001BE7BB76|nr:hypothetical protein [Planococcus sp. ISL-110]MBT2570062.1 hypothetical protein [Planococcus sp. ISL-110]